MVTAKSVPDAVTVTLAEAELLPVNESAGTDAMVPVSVIVAPPVTCTVVAKVVVVPEASVAIVQVKVVVPEQVQPAAVGAVTSEVFAGNASVKVRLVAFAGPVYFRTCVKVI